MSRYTGPRARVSRRLGTNIWGTNGENIAMEKRPYPPGDHGRTRRRGNVSEYLLQLQEKQKARYAYGMTEKQFRNLYEEANRRQGVTGENLIMLLESRLDNLVYRLMYAQTRRESRQMVNHGHICVNDKPVDISSYVVKVGDKISPKKKDATINRIKARVESLDDYPLPDWLSLDKTTLEGKVLREPTKADAKLPVEESLIVELFSK